MNIVAVVPTTGRASLSRALESIDKQVRTPDHVLVCSDESLNQALPTGVHGLINTRTPGLSGAINTCIYHFMATADAKDTVVCLLDDDDEWLPDYLVAVEDAIHGADFTWAGLLRQHERGESLWTLPIVQDLDVGDALTGNPHIQGSNLAIRLDAFLRAGGMDEHLPSTTDRDLLIRLLDIGARGTAINEHLVLHDATGDQRLSTPGNPRKATGLNRFYEKHAHRMTSDQQAAFKARCAELFQVSIEIKLAAPEAQFSPLTDEPTKRPLWIGVSCGDAEKAKQLAEGLRVLGEVASCVVICTFGDEESCIQEILASSGAPIKFMDVESAWQDAASGMFGEAFMDSARQSGIPFGRRCCEHYLLHHAPDDAVFWLVDDDCGLGNLHWGDPANAISPSSVSSVVARLEAQGIDIGVGAMAGGAPLPALATLRTRLLDAAHAAPIGPGHARLRLAYPEYYYDLSERHTAHLETPAHGQPHGRWVEQAHTWFSESDVPTRGGNTLIIGKSALKSLATAPVASIARRQDTLAAIHARETCRVVHVPFHIGHRSAKNDLQALVDDIRGAAATRTIVTDGGDATFVERRAWRCVENAWRLEGLLDVLARRGTPWPEEAEARAHARAMKQIPAILACDAVDGQPLGVVA